MEPKAKTITERFGFKDPQLTTPQHDALMFWLDEHAQNVVSGLFTAWPPSAHDRAAKSLQEVRQNFPDFDPGPVPNMETPVVTEKEWEYPISDRSYVIGFIDMRIRVEGRSWSYHVDLPNYGKKPTEGWSARMGARDLLVEVKPEILSVGEVVRQIQMYRKYLAEISTLCRPEIYVASPDDRFCKLFASQKIGFIKTPLA
jgi:hypothetical protein